MATATDDFQRGNETPLAGNWTSFGSGGGSPGNQFNLNTNVVVPSALANDAWSWWTAFSAQTDQYSQAVLTATDTASDGSGPGLAVRATGTTNANHNFYRVVFSHGSTQTMEISRFNAGARSSLKVFNQAWTDGDTWRLEIAGFVLTVKLNGATITTFDDSASGSKLSSGAPGLSYSSTATAATLDLWDGGDLPTGNVKAGSGIIGP